MPQIVFNNPQRDSSKVSAYSRQVLVDIMKVAGLSSLTVTSTMRTAHDQARIMLHNIERHGVAAQKHLYAAAGDKVIDTYVSLNRVGKTREQIMAGMTRRINAIGPHRVSHHVGDPRKLNVIDVAPSSITNKSAFEAAVRADDRVAKFLLPPSDPSYHLEIPQNVDKTPRQDNAGKSAKAAEAGS